MKKQQQAQLVQIRTINIVVSSRENLEASVVFESSNKHYVLIKFNHSFHLANKNNEVILSLQEKFNACCISKDENYFAILSTLTQKIKVTWFDLKKKVILWQNEIFINQHNWFDLQFQEDKLLLISLDWVRVFDIQGNVLVYNLFNKEKNAYFYDVQLLKSNSSFVLQYYKQTNRNNFPKEKIEVVQLKKSKQLKTHCFKWSFEEIVQLDSNIVLMLCPFTITIQLKELIQLKLLRKFFQIEKSLNFDFTNGYGRIAILNFGFYYFSNDSYFKVDFGTAITVEHLLDFLQVICIIFTN